MPTTLKAAVVSWLLEAAPAPDEALPRFLDHLERVVRQTTSAGADLVLLPESIDLERLAPHLRAEPQLPSHEVPARLAPDFPAVLAHAQSLAKKHRITLLAGTHLRQTPGGFLNTAVLATPDATALQDKNVLTQWEINDWRLTPGAGLAPLANPPLGALVCYDSEFPPAGRALAEAGTQILAIPAFTETRRGFHRVRWSAQARAVECQFFVLHASLVGTLAAEPVPQAYGSSAIVCPTVHPLPESGILAETPLHTPDHPLTKDAITYADIDLDLVEIARQSDDVRNWHDRDKGHWQINPLDR